MTELILIRHGETAWNRERRMQGQTNTPLSDTGRAQAEAVGRRLARHPFSALYSSDLQRAWDTAAAIARASGRDIVSEPRLRERTFGVFEGLTYDEMAQHHPLEHARFAQRDPDYAVPGGESPRQFFERSLGCLEDIAAAHAGECVVVVTHGLVLDTLYRAARNMPLDFKREVPLLNASLNTFQRAPQAWIEVAWGDVEHLAAVGVTRYDGRAM
ncbi:MAG TPA: histidine phosphatase family protein [Burkholderiales bacterium]|nr:histidine phosphatase family protein [Burkholderiales bacterium]